ncbi:basic salivary proline-rich protein 3-like [Homalodisca vitripennis]|uniref:basic salivary proline-rich protein 3-like n=1 Tax=Homalodisca vitripennis TaxID=197043 RepID=UPI001EEA8D69|nr:basic salivary proline-rich protein 3-like [Homalodisca vitripennis]KAG8258194.1 hypothetical protein J6590_033665 [Homalodisca vitripennis]
MAARRAAAKAAAAAAAEPPPPPEPAPEPEPEKKEPEKADEKKPSDEDEANKGQNGDSKTGRVAERIIERIIICPGGQNPYMAPPPPPPPQGICHCVPIFVDRPKKKQDKGKGKRKGGDDKENEPCKHPFCIVQRARTKPQGLPWASGLYKQQHPTQGPETPPPPPVVICQRPVMCCCPKCRPPPESDSEDEDPPREDTETFMTFMNMVFAAANVMNENPHAF